MCPGSISSSCYMYGIRRGTLVTYPLISHKWEKDWIMIPETEHIRGHLWHRYSVSVNLVLVETVKLSKWWLQISQYETLDQ